MMMMTTRLWRSLVAIVFAMTLLAGWLAGEARGQEIEMQTTPGQIKAAQISPEILKLLPPSLMFSPATVDVVIRHEDSSHGKEASSSVNSSSEAASVTTTTTTSKKVFVDQVHLPENKVMLLLAAYVLLVPGGIWIILNIWICFQSNGLCSLQVSPQKKRVIESKDSNVLPYHLGNTSARYSAGEAGGGIPQLEEEEKIDVKFQDLSYWIGPKKKKKGGTSCKLLRDLSGSFCAGKLSAIMGPSGAGKSTLLDILALRRNKGFFTGSIKVNSDVAWKGYCAYVEQVDQVIEELGVEENLMFYAHLKLRKASLEEKRARVSVLLHQLRLVECRNVRAGGSSNSISGGQKRRLSVAIELLDLPKVIFLDEPTSGLDASSALELIQLLKSIAESGRTIGLTIHQPRPEIFSTIDYLYILAKGGSYAYGGTPEDANAFFKSFALRMGDENYKASSDVGTADLILDILSKPISSEAIKRARESPAGCDPSDSYDQAGLDCGGPWVCGTGDAMVTGADVADKHALKHTLSAEARSGGSKVRQGRVCSRFVIGKLSPIVRPLHGGHSAGRRTSANPARMLKAVVENVKNDLWSVVMLSVREKKGRGQGQGNKRFQFFFVNLAACFILSSVYWQYHVRSYADMFPLMSSMYLTVISAMMVVQFTHFNLFISEARNLAIDQKRDAYSSLSYFVHCLIRDSFFFVAGTAVCWVPAAFSINFAGSTSTAAGALTSLLIVALFVNFFGSFIRLVTLVWSKNLHVANVVVGFLLAWCVMFSGLFVYVSALPIWWKWAPWGSPAYYCLRSLFYTIISKKTVDTSCDALEDMSVQLACLVQPDAFAAVGETALVRTGYSEANLWLDLLVLIGFHAVFRAIFGLTLAWKNKNSFLKWCVSSPTDD